MESFKAGVEIKLRDAEVAVWRREGDELREILAAVAKARGVGWFILVDELPGAAQAPRGGRSERPPRRAAAVLVP
jgi:hypothetical protein